MNQSNLPERIQVDPKDIYLRQLGTSDVSDEYVNWLNDSDTNKFLEIRHSTPFSRNDVIAFVKNCLDIRRHHWGVFVKGQHVGNISCSKYNHLYRWVDISNLIGNKRYQYSNLGKLALAGAIEYLFTEEKFHRISAGTYSNHFAGITLLTNIGFKKEGVLRDAAISNNRYVDELRFSILEEEWTGRAKKYPHIMVNPPPWRTSSREWRPEARL